MITSKDDERLKIIMRKMMVAAKEEQVADAPKITVLEEGPGSLVRIRVEYTDEQIERLRKRPKFGYQIPFDKGYERR